MYFVDAAHFVFGAFLGYLWCAVRLFVRCPSGRKRFNILGALNIMTHAVITVSNDTYINSQSVCKLLSKLRQVNGSRPITVFLDNAPYQRAALVQDKADELKIDLEFLPSYSPNLNLIERFWKFTKQKCLYSKYYETFESFSATIRDFVSTASKKHKSELKTLLAANFQSFEDAQVQSV